MAGTLFRRAIAAVVLLLLLASVGLTVTSGLAGAWIRALQKKMTDGGLSTRNASHCCLPLSGRPRLLLRPSPAVSTSTSVMVNSVRLSWPDCPNAVSMSPKVLQTTTGGCQLNDVHNFLYGHGVKETVATDLLSKCDVVPPNLVGPIKVLECKACISDLEELDFHLEAGGHYRPRHCIPRASAAIIIPFRSRWEHLTELLLNMHPLLQKQELEYTIYVINQVEGSKFNRGMLFNVGTVETAKIRNYTCYIFHDVDLITENDNNLYRCPTGFHHYSIAIDKHNYKLPYETIAGGVLAADRGAFEKINGYSNLFFGWGGEDDDVSSRISAGGYHLERYSSDVGRYKMIKHGSDVGNEPNPERWQLLQKTSSRKQADGLNSLIYKVVDIKYAKLFTFVNVSISQQDVMNKFSGVAAQAKKRR